jgi:hypothetical protein
MVDGRSWISKEEYEWKEIIEILYGLYATGK